jgi:8-oxo-dGTP pyrophosphatase MutT (NUDIX family)
MSDAAAPRPAATVILLRDGPDGPELWLAERARSMGFMAAAWVFPGGRVDAKDGDASQGLAAFRAAGARELAEEAGVTLDPAGLKVWSHWLTPEIEPRRFDTWFFAAALPAGQRAVVDGSEAVRGMWMRAKDAVDRCQAGELPLAPPTLRTAMELSRFASVADILAAERRTPVICPAFHQEGESFFVLLPGDPLHPSPEAVEPPHRYVFDIGRWWAR